METLSQLSRTTETPWVELYITVKERIDEHDCGAEKSVNGEPVGAGHALEKDLVEAAGFTYTIEAHESPIPRRGVHQTKVRAADLEVGARAAQKERWWALAALV